MVLKIFLLLLFLCFNAGSEWWGKRRTFGVKCRNVGNTKQITTVIFHKCTGLTGSLI